jgi:formate hydrogenlyase subunit 6/NADH:ubiquinone oxidoreductase subunit I
MLEVLERITLGKGKETDIDLLLDLAQRVKNTSLCGLGQTAPNPVLTTIKYFRAEYEAHISNRKCPAHHCSQLLTYSITDECTGCLLCKRACKFDAISGEKKSKHVIDMSKCTKCGECHKVCNFHAVARD